MTNKQAPQSAVGGTARITERSREVRDAESLKLLGWLVGEALPYKGAPLTLQIQVDPADNSFEGYKAVYLGWGYLMHSNVGRSGEGEIIHYLTADKDTAKLLRKHPGFYRIGD